VRVFLRSLGMKLSGTPPRARASAN
jgi:hypothetical protein